MLNRDVRSAEQALCEVLREVGDFAGAGAALLWPARGQRVALASTGGTFQLLAELQFTLWEGPDPAAFEAGRPVVTVDVLSDARRWPMLTAELGARGVVVGAHAVAPLTHDGRTLGLVGVYRSDHRGITEAEVTLLIAYAAAITATVLHRGPRAEDSDVGEPPDPREAQLSIAVGMVSSYLSVSGIEAAAVLRAHAFLADTTLLGLAHDLVARDLPLRSLVDEGRTDPPISPP